MGVLLENLGWINNKGMFPETNTLFQAKNVIFLHHTALQTWLIDKPIIYILDSGRYQLSMNIDF